MAVLAVLIVFCGCRGTEADLAAQALEYCSPLLISSFTGTYELALPQAGAFGLKGNPTLPRQLAYLHNTRDFYYLLDSGSE